MRKAEGANKERLTAKIQLSLKPSLQKAIDKRAIQMGLSRQDLCRVALSLVANEGLKFDGAG